MSSDAKLEANRLNAAKSTGPRTPEGKAIARMNALRHGLLSLTVLLPGEDAEILSGFRERALQQLKPSGEIEQLLADRVVAIAWRLRRAAQIEVEVLNRGKNEVRLPDLLTRGGLKPDLGSVFLRDAAGADCFGKLSRYESALERALYRALHELQRLQAVRAGEPVPAPVAVDVTVDGGFVSRNPPVRVALEDLEV